MSVCKHAELVGGVLASGLPATFRAGGGDGGGGGGGGGFRPSSAHYPSAPVPQKHSLTVPRLYVINTKYQNICVSALQEHLSTVPWPYLIRNVCFPVCAVPDRISTMP